MNTPTGFFSSKKSGIGIQCILINEFSIWLKQQSGYIQSWIKVQAFSVKHGAWLILPSEKTPRVIFIYDPNAAFLEIGKLPLQLPEGDYFLENINCINAEKFILAWGLGAYQFSEFKKPTRQSARLFLEKSTLKKHPEVFEMIRSIHLGRDWINFPAESCHPKSFSGWMKSISDQHSSARFSEIVGDDLLKKEFRLIHAVGRGSVHAPRLLEIRYGNPKHKRITLVGKGVCFDSGGLDIKPPNNMLLMKKDMGGAAIVLALSNLIMAMNLPIYLHVVIPVVENAVDGKSYRPGDVFKSRAGLTVEIGNTDAEGRLILADAIHYAVNQKIPPDYLIDISTLTGAARIALGTELPALFSNSDELANLLMQSGEAVIDPMWRMPLYSPYQELNQSNIADINNSSSESYGGAITAALFLQAFIPAKFKWAHFDVMAWNTKTKPARPQGGEVMLLRAIYAFVKGIAFE